MAYEPLIEYVAGELRIYVDRIRRSERAGVCRIKLPIPDPEYHPLDVTWENDAPPAASERGE